MKLLDKIKEQLNWAITKVNWRKNKQFISVSALAAFLFLSLGYQYLDYHALSAEENAAHAEKIGQRVVIDLNDKKWFPKNLADATNVVADGEVKFAPDAAGAEIAIDSIPEDLTDFTPQEKPAHLADGSSEDDDALTISEKERLLKQKGKVKPTVKALENENQISIIIVNLGLNDSVLKQVTRLSKNFTLSFTPYGQLTTKSSVSMSEEGYDIVAELPMESSKKREDGGKFSLSSVNDEYKNLQNFEAIHSIIPTAAAFLTPEDEDFSDHPRFKEIIKLIQSKDTSLIYTGKAKKNMRDLSSIYGIETIIPDITIDNQPSTDDINAQLRALETIAKEKGYAVGLAHSYPITIENLEKWQETLKDKNIKLVRAVD